jgi:hypothetical protein
MNVFLGDVVTLLKVCDEDETLVTGQVTGIVLDTKKELERVYVQGIDTAFWMNDGWKFMETIVEDDE